MFRYARVSYRLLSPVAVVVVGEVGVEDGADVAALRWVCVRLCVCVCVCVCLCKPLTGCACVARVWVWVCVCLDVL